MGGGDIGPQTNTIYIFLLLYNKMKNLLIIFNATKSSIFVVSRSIFLPFLLFFLLLRLLSSHHFSGNYIADVEQTGLRECGREREAHQTLC